MKCLHRYLLYSLSLTLLSGTQLFWEDFSDNITPPGWEMELNWQVGSVGWENHVIGDPSPGAYFYWAPSLEDYEKAMTTPVINVGDESQVLVEFFFELDYYQAGGATNGLKIEYLSGGNWVTVLSYEISPSAGDVDLSGRYESFKADVNGDFQIRWVAYGTNSTYINSWDVDNIRVSTLPKLTYVNIESSNEDPSTAYEGTDISLKFTADTDFGSNDPYVQINGTPCTVDNLGGTDWVATYSVQASDPDGPLQFTIDFTDINGVDGKTVKETTDGSTVIVDNSDPPTFMVGTVTAAGGIVAPDIWNSTNTEIQLEVNIPEDSAVTSFSYTIGNSLLFNGMNDEVIISGITDYQATDALTIEAWIKPNSWSDFDGILNYAADQGTSEAGFGFVYFATGWRFFLKTTSNSIDYINMAEVSTPSGQWTHLAATYDGQKVRIYRNGSAIDSTDAMGDIQWSGAPSDFKLGSFTKDGSTGYFDGQIDDVRIWNIVRTGVQIKGSRETTIDKNESGLVGYWQMDAGSGGTVTDSTSSANHGTINGATWVIEDSPLNFQAPVYDTGVIVGSAFQLRGRANTNDFEVFGVKDTITVDDLNAGIKTVSASSDAFEAITDFAHEETAQLSAFLFDVTGNYSSGDTSITNTVIDIITNSPTPVSISSDNTFSHLAKTGDIVTITMAYDEDVNTPAVAVDGNDADDVSDLGGEQFSSTYTLTGSESEGSLSFSINTTDYLGNPGSHLGSTDGSTVVYDKTLPTLSPVSIASNNADTTWAKANDSISVTFTSSERISADFALSFDGIDDEVKITGSGFISGNEPRSISVWADGSSGNIVSLGDGAGTSNQRFSILIPSDRRVRIIGQNNDWNTNYYLPQNQMTHLVVTHDGSTVKLYANGVFQNQISKTYNTDSSMPIMIGTNTDDRNSEYFNGIIDNIIITRDALSIAEVSALYNGSDVALDNLIAKFNFNEGNGSVAYDQSGNGNDGDLTNMDLTSAWFFQGGSGPTATIMSQDASISTLNNDQFRADYTTTITDPEGEVQFGISFADPSGNDGETVISTTNNSRVIFDRTAPVDFTLGIVTANGGNVVANAWNSTNTGLDVTVPVESDTTLKNGWIQVWTKVGINAFEKLGDSTTIANSDVGTDKVISFTSEQVEAITGFAEEDTLTIKAIMSDRPGNETEGSQSINRLVIDQVLPTVLSSHIESNNADSTKSKVDNIVTITFQTDEIIQSPSSTISGGAATITDLGSFNWSAVYTMTNEDDEGVILFTVDSLVDARGNPASGFTTLSDGSEVIFDRTKPELDQVQAQTNNTWNNLWALEDEYARLYINASEDLLSINCTFNGLVTTDNQYGPDEYDLGYTFSNTDTEGLVAFEIVFVDSAGNAGDTVRASTDNTYIVFDKTAPSGFTVGNVSATGGNVVATFWNSTNTDLDVIVPIDSDSTLDSGRVQIWAKVGANNFEMLGNSSFILSSEVGATKTMSIPGDSVRAITGYTENDTLIFNAYIFDIPGNEMEGIKSTTTLLIDETPPSLISASYESNFSDSSLATVGHIVTLIFETDVEIQTPSATISTQNAIMSDLGSNRWSASYEMQDGDTEGVIPFQIDTLTDSRGNPTVGSSTTTDGTDVTFDNTQPTLNPVTILSDNSDTEWAKVGDTVTVTFTGEETLISQTASIVTQSAAITDLGGQVYTAKYKMTESDSEGEVAFEIIVTDRLEIDSDPVTQTNDGTAVTFDRTAPTLSPVHIESDNANNTLIAIGGDNIYLTFTPDEPLILDSIVVTIAGLATILTESDGSYTATLILTGSEPNGILEYTIDFRDRAGNPGVQVTATTDESYVNHDIYPPEIEIASITSNNSDSSWAKVGDSVFVTFTASEILDDISITIAGVSSNYNELSLAKYQGYHVMDDSNDEGNIPFLITYTDLGGAIGPDADTTTNNTNVQFDKTVPEISLIRMATNNIYGDSLAGIGSVDTLSFTISEVQNDLSVELAGSAKTASQNGIKFSSTHTFIASDTEGWVDFSISMTDSAGNPSDTLITTQDGSQVWFDGTLPILPIVNFFSNNSNDSSLCIPGDSLFLQYTSSETLRTATITLAGNSPDESGWLGGFNYASYVLTGAENEGFIPFTIGFEDWVGNPGDTISGTTNGSSVLFDMTPPDDFTLGDVVSKNGTEVAGYWNASNQTLEIVIPVPNDETLPGGGIQFQASFGGSYSNLADTVDIDESDLGMGKMVSISEIDFENTPEFNENENAIFQAILWDRAGNTTIGIASTSTIHIDQTLPILGMVSQRTNNAIAGSLAKVGDTDTLIVSSTEGLDTLQVQIFSQDALHSGANRDWTFTYSFQETDNDDMVSFNIVFGDTAGNLGTDVSTTTDGSTVRFDGTKPTLTSVSFSSTNILDGGLAILADTLNLDFISDEDLLTKEVLIAGFAADTTFENDFRTPFRSWRIMDGTEPEGYIEFEIRYSDLVGNIGDTVEETTNETSILFDMTPPDDFELDTVFVSGGKVIFGFWNASNDTLTLRVPFSEEDETLIGGTFQSQIRFGEGAYVNLGDEKTIIGGQGVSSQDLIITRMEFTTIDGFSENLNVQFIAKVKDRAGNETIGSTDNTILHIDEIMPSLTEVLIQSNNELDSTWAKISDIISLNFTASEGLSFVTPVLFSDSLTGISENAGSSWTATKTILSDNAEGIIPFYITYNDTAGNDGDQVSSSTDGRFVTLDKTNPTITSLLEGKEGLDIDFYNQADSITLYWSQFDSLAGVKDAYVGLGTDSNLTDVLDWTLSNQGSVAGLGGLSLSNDGIYFGAVFVRDSSGNHSDTLWGNSIYIDTQNPDTGSVIDAYWVMDLDYAIDSTRLSYIWSNFTDNTEIDYFEIAIGTEDDTTNVMNWMRSDSTDSMTVTGLNLVRDTLYYSYIRAFDLATNKSLAARTDGIYFDDSFPVVNKITPNVISDSAGFLSVLANDTLTIKFNRPIYVYGLSVNSNVDSNFTVSHEYGDSIITVIWTDTLASYDTLTVIVDSAVAYNTLWLTDTLHFYSKLWADLNNDYDITVEDILTFNQTWPETDLGPFEDNPPHVRPQPDGEANLLDLAAFGKMWHWKYFNLEFDKTLIAARSTEGLEIIAKGSKANITIPKDVAMAEILIGESNLDIEKMHFVNPSGSAFMFTSSDTAHGLIQFSMADHRGFDSTLTLIIPETEQEYFQAQIQYKFMDITGVTLADGIASVDVEILPEKFMVYNNYPNPFNPITAINYDLPEVRDVNIIIYDLLGRTIRHLDLNKVKAGRHKFVWHGTNDFGKRVSTGIYFLQITAGQDIQSQKMLLLK